MTQATGVGGVFLRATDPEKLYAFVFFGEGPREMVILAVFPSDTEYLVPPGSGPCSI